LTATVGNKVDKVSGKGLSTNDYTTTEKNKLAGIASGAEVNVQVDWNETDTRSAAYIKNKPTGGGGGAGTIPYFVAAADATDEEKAVAFAVCTGTNDQTTINSVLSQLDASKGGRIILGSGTFWITGPINIGKNVTIEGTGKSTELILKGRGTIFNLKIGDRLRSFRIVRDSSHLWDGDTRLSGFYSYNYGIYDDDSDYIISIDCMGDDTSTFNGIVIEDLYFSHVDHAYGLDAYDVGHNNNGLGPVIRANWSEGLIIRNCVFNTAAAESSDDWWWAYCNASSSHPVFYFNYCGNLIFHNNYIGRDTYAQFDYCDYINIAVGGYKCSLNHDLKSQYPDRHERIINFRGCSGRVQLLNDEVWIQQQWSDITIV
ncbi:MAG: hypothetical protein K2O54_00055, partial [Prevotella sp.]|nr:hypothetical protein [Prevotella sp.]